MGDREREAVREAVREADPEDTTEAAPEREDTTGAYDWRPLVDEGTAEPPEEYQNPAGVGRGACDTDAAEQDESCDIEETAQVEDLALEETKPGIGILGFEGEEVGGG